jgi:hypothetical protein
VLCSKAYCLEGIFRKLGINSGRIFGSNMDSMPEAAAVVPGAVLIPVRFVWKHGGSSVYLCGSFTQ